MNKENIITITQINNDKQELEKQILLLIHEFEQKYKHIYIEEIALSQKQDLEGNNLTKKVELGIAKN